MNKSKKFSPEVRERAVRMVREHRDAYPSLWTAVESIAPPRIGCVPQTLLEWVKRQEVDAGARDGVTTAGAQRVKELEREVTTVARCTVERLMRRQGLRGVMRGKVVRNQRQQSDLSAGQSESAVPGRAAEPALGLGL